MAVNGITWDVKRGKIFRLLGPGSAGKTNSLEGLEGLSTPVGGSLAAVGVDPAKEPAKLRHVIGVQLHSPGLLETTTTTEAMKFFCAELGALHPAELEVLTPVLKYRGRVKYERT